MAQASWMLDVVLTGEDGASFALRLDGPVSLVAAPSEWCLIDEPLQVVVPLKISRSRVQIKLVKIWCDVRYLHVGVLRIQLAWVDLSRRKQSFNVHKISS